jgi:hypothetical protein
MLYIIVDGGFTCSIYRILIGLNFVDIFGRTKRIAHHCIQLR